MNKDFGIYTDLYNSIINDLRSGKIQSTIRFIRKQIAEVSMSIRNLTIEIPSIQNTVMKAELERNLQLAEDKYHVLDLLYTEYAKIKYGF